MLLALGRWGSREPLPPGDRALGVDAFVLALPTLFDEAAAARVRTTVELRLGCDRFTARVQDGRLDVRRGDAGHPDAVLEGHPDALTAVLWHGRRLEDAQGAGELRIEGDRDAALRFLRLFPAPRPATAR